MKKRLLIGFLTVCFVFLPLTSFAENEDVRALFAAGSYPYADSVYENNEIAQEAKLTLAYRPDEQKASKDAPEIGCRAAYVADPATGKVFYEKNAHKKMYPASTTKILTALVVLENCGPEELVTVSQRAIALMPPGYSNANLKAGEQFTVYTMLQALLIPSGNEAANALAEHVSGSVAAFADLCNQRAKELGCKSLHFVNPNGVHNKRHYCSAYDLFLIAKECRQYDVFNEIVKTKSFTVPATEIYPKSDRTYRNTNELLFSGGKYYLPGCSGIKTGHTPEAGECLVASSTTDDLDLICVVLGGRILGNTNERFSDSKKLLEFVYAHYAYRVIAERTQPLVEVNVLKAVKDQATLKVMIPTDIYAVAPIESTPESVHPQIKLAEEIKAPIKQNQVLGSVSYHVDGLVYTTNLVANNDVEKKPFWLYNTLVLLGLILIALGVACARKRRVQKANAPKRRADNP